MSRCLANSRADHIGSQRPRLAAEIMGVGKRPDIDDLDRLAAAIAERLNATPSKDVRPLSVALQAVVRSMEQEGRLKKSTRRLTKVAFGHAAKAIGDVPVCDLNREHVSVLFQALGENLSTYGPTIRARLDGASLSHVRKALGHKSAKTTERYSHGISLRGPRRAVELVEEVLDGRKKDDCD